MNSSMAIVPYIPPLTPVEHSRRGPLPAIDVSLESPLMNRSATLYRADRDFAIDTCIRLARSILEYPKLLQRNRAAICYTPLVSDKESDTSGVEKVLTDTISEPLESSYGFAEMARKMAKMMKEYDKAKLVLLCWSISTIPAGTLLSLCQQESPALIHEDLKETDLFPAVRLNDVGSIR